MTIKPTSHRFKKAVSRLRQMLNSGEEILRASWTKMTHPCGKSGCKCARGKKHWHTNYYISQSKNGRQRMKSVPREYVRALKARTDAYKRARELLAVIGDEYWQEFCKKQK